MTSDFYPLAHQKMPTRPYHSFLISVDFFFDLYQPAHSFLQRKKVSKNSALPVVFRQLIFTHPAHLLGPPSLLGT